MECYDREMKLCERKIWSWIDQLIVEIEFSSDHEIDKMFSYVDDYLKWWLNAAHKQMYLFTKVCCFFVKRGGRN